MIFLHPFGCSKPIQLRIVLKLVDNQDWKNVSKNLLLDVKGQDLCWFAWQTCIIIFHGMTLKLVNLISFSRNSVGFIKFRVQSLDVAIFHKRRNCLDECQRTIILFFDMSKPTGLDSMKNGSWSQCHHWGFFIAI